MSEAASKRITRVKVLVEGEGDIPDQEFVLSLMDDWRMTSPPQMISAGADIALERIADTLRYVNEMLEKRAANRQAHVFHAPRTYACGVHEPFTDAGIGLTCPHYHPELFPERGAQPRG